VPPGAGLGVSHVPIKPQEEPAQTAAGEPNAAGRGASARSATRANRQKSEKTSENQQKADKRKSSSVNDGARPEQYGFDFASSDDDTPTPVATLMTLDRHLGKQLAGSDLRTQANAPAVGGVETRRSART